MALYDANTYPDLLRNLQIYSAQKRASTGRGMTPQEMQGAVKGFQDSENERRLGLYKQSMATQAAQNINNQNAMLKNRELNTADSAATMKGVMSLPVSGREALTAYKIGKSILAPAKAAVSTAEAVGTPLGNAVPSLTAPAYTPAYGLEASSPAIQGILSSGSTGTLAAPVSEAIAPTLASTTTAATAAEPAFDAAANGVAYAANGGQAASAITPILSGTGYAAAAMFLKGLLGKFLDQPGGEDGSSSRDIGENIGQGINVWNASADPTATGSARDLNNFWQFLNTGAPAGATAYTNLGEGPYNWLSDAFGLSG